MTVLSLMAECHALVYHRWPDAPAGRDYLRTAHPHDFRLTAELVQVVESVADDERRVELHDLRDALHALSATLQPVEGDASCEGMARYLAEGLVRMYPGWTVTAGVYEEGNLGAKVTVS